MTNLRTNPLSPIAWATRRAARRAGAYLHLKVPSRIVEIAPKHPWLKRAMPWARTAIPLELHRLRRLAEIAGDDPGVAGLIVELSPITSGWASCQALRDVLVRLDARGKDIVVHLPLGGTIRDVYVAS
ncbi:MAG: hypothetical protein H5U40_08215, partial [Polyangiaceae bacterium]|nr:hypothetical protein [Polyangiaceae bacterium]